MAIARLPSASRSCGVDCLTRPNRAPSRRHIARSAGKRISPGHYKTWAQWRRDRILDPALRALVRAYEYEDWPRGRIVFDRARLFGTNFVALLVFQLSLAFR